VVAERRRGVAVGTHAAANLIRPQLRKLDPRVERRLRRYADRVREPVHWGTLRRSDPFDDDGGWGRGVPVDRLLTERFIGRHATDLRGDVLESGQGALAERFGGTRVRRIEVLGSTPNPKSTFIADLCEPGALGDRQFDCCLMGEDSGGWTAPRVALAALWRSLAPGGVLLVATPVLGRLRPGDPQGPGRWCATPAHLASHVDEACPAGEVSVGSLGGLVTALAALLGLAGDEVRPGDLAADDPRYPVVAGARVRKVP
jgi:SAM-dependent methyltransferase